MTSRLWRATLVSSLLTASMVSSWSIRAAPTAIPVSVSLAEGFEIPKPKGLELRLLNDAQDGVLNDVDFVSAALVASGVAEADIDT